MKLSDIITPEKFRQLATHITICDENLGLTGTEVQDDLRKFADALEGMEAKNISSNAVSCDSVCPKCKFEPMIKVDEKYNCEMCGYVDGQTVANTVLAVVRFNLRGFNLKIYKNV